MTGRLNKKKLATQERAFEITNEDFRSRKILPASAYAHMESYGVEIDSSFLLEWIPDDQNNYTVDLIRQDGTVLRFDHCTNENNESPIEITDDFMNSVRRSSQKPWTRASIAWRAFEASKK